jgi:hypothetical protein
VVSRLATLAPELEEALLKTTAERRATIGLAAAKWAIERTGLKDPVVLEALSGNQSASLTSVIATLDERYFRLKEEADEGRGVPLEWQRVFSAARAASAVDFAIRGNASEAIYEAAQATDHLVVFREFILKELGAV